MRALKFLRKQIILNDRGLSLPEVMVTTLIFSFVAAGLYSTIVVGESSWQHNKSKIELNQGLRQGMEWMKFELQQAGNSSILDVPADGQWYDDISFKIPTGILNGTITWDANSIQYIKGGANNDQLLRNYNAQTKVLAMDISSVQFRRMSGTPNILEVNLSGSEKAIKGQTLQGQLDFKVKLRNN